MSTERLKSLIAEHHGALTKDPDNPDLLASLGALYEDYGNNEEASHYNYEAAKRYETLGQYQDAAEYCSKSLKLNPKHTGASALLHELGDLPTSQPTPMPTAEHFSSEPTVDSWSEDEHTQPGAQSPYGGQPLAAGSGALPVTKSQDAALFSQTTGVEDEPHHVGVKTTGGNVIAESKTEVGDEEDDTLSDSDGEFGRGLIPTATTPVLVTETNAGLDLSEDEVVVISDDEPDFAEKSASEILGSKLPSNVNDIIKAPAFPRHSLVLEPPYNDMGEIRNFIKGETIIEAGQKGDSFILLESGTAHVSCQGKTLGLLEAGAFIGEFGVLGDGKRYLSVEGEISGSIRLIDRIATRRLMKENAQAKKVIRRAYRDRLQSMLIVLNDLLGKLSKTNAEKIFELGKPAALSKGKKLDVEAGHLVFLLLGEVELEKIQLNVGGCVRVDEKLTLIAPRFAQLLVLETSVIESFYQANPSLKTIVDALPGA